MLVNETLLSLTNNISVKSFKNSFNAVRKQAPLSSV